MEEAIKGIIGFSEERLGDGQDIVSVASVPFHIEDPMGEIAVIEEPFLNADMIRYLIRVVGWHRVRQPQQPDQERQAGCDHGAQRSDQGRPQDPFHPSRQAAL